MKKQDAIRGVEQPEPFTPGLTREMVREYVQRLCERKLLDREPTTLEDWVLVEYDLVEELQKQVS